MEKFTGDSFRDLTRIAKINDLMWSELFVANKDALLGQMDLFIDKFQELKTMIETDGKMEEFEVLPDELYKRFGEEK